MQCADDQALVQRPALPRDSSPGLPEHPPAPSGAPPSSPAPPRVPTPVPLGGPGAGGPGRAPGASASPCRAHHAHSQSSSSVPALALAPDERAVLYKFLRTPLEMEKTVLLGFFACMDAMLFVLTVLPLRALHSLLCGAVCLASSGRVKRRWLEFTPTRAFELAQGLLMAACLAGLSFVESSDVYHLIRGQSTLKLYVIYNVMELLDRLCSSFGLDLFDAVYWSVKRRPAPSKEHFSLATHVVIACAYLMVHSMILFTMLMTLNVTVNSYSSGLLTLLVSNNILELKGNVSKRFEYENMFQMSCADALERMQLFTFLILIAVHNLSAVGWDVLSQTRMITNVLWAAMAIWTTECLVDWMKHSFIVKNNGLSLRFYQAYRTALCVDVAVPRPTEAPFPVFDRTHVLSRRVGFSRLPLTCVAIRVLVRSIPAWPALASLVLLGAFRLVLRKVLLRLASDSLKHNELPDGDTLSSTFRCVMAKASLALALGQTCGAVDLRPHVDTKIRAGAVEIVVTAAKPPDGAALVAKFGHVLVELAQSPLDACEVTGKLTYSSLNDLVGPAVAGCALVDTPGPEGRRPRKTVECSLTLARSDGAGAPVTKKFLLKNLPRAVLRPAAAPAEPSRKRTAYQVKWAEVSRTELSTSNDIAVTLLVAPVPAGAAIANWTAANFSGHVTGASWGAPAAVAGGRQQWVFALQLDTGDVCVLGAGDSVTLTPVVGAADTASPVVLSLEADRDTCVGDTLGEADFALTATFGRNATDFEAALQSYFDGERVYVAVDVAFLSGAVDASYDVQGVAVGGVQLNVSDPAVYDEYTCAHTICYSFVFDSLTMGGIGEKTLVTSINITALSRKRSGTDPRMHTVSSQVITRLRISPRARVPSAAPAHAAAPAMGTVLRVPSGYVALLLAAAAVACVGVVSVGLLAVSNRRPEKSAQ
eukprot:m51a1_g980 hypothetical protein (933) ;mRNA; f:418711-423567